MWSYVGHTFSTSRQYCARYTVELEGTALSPARELIPLLVEQELRLFSCRKTQWVDGTSRTLDPRPVGGNAALPSAAMFGEEPILGEATRMTQLRFPPAAMHPSPPDRGPRSCQHLEISNIHIWVSGRIDRCTTF